MRPKPRVGLVQGCETISAGVLIVNTKSTIGPVRARSAAMQSQAAATPQAQSSPAAVCGGAVYQYN
jgi:hypothetical protein